MAGIFDRLQFPSHLAADTTEFSEQTRNTLDSMPPIVSDWQKDDIASGSTSGYLKNPLAANTALLLSIVDDINANATLHSLSELESINAATISANTACKAFKAHCDRISGVVEMNTNTYTKPHYQQAMGVAKALAHIIYQTDGISNNAVMIGSFGSLYRGANLANMIITLSPYPEMISNSMNANTVMIEPDVYSITWSTNLSSEMITQITDDVSNVTTLLTTYRTGDENFYTNANAVVEDYNKVKMFSELGQTENYMLNNLIGTDKLLERIGS